MYLHHLASLRRIIYRIVQVSFQPSGGRWHRSYNVTDETTSSQSATRLSGRFRHRYQYLSLAYFLRWGRWFDRYYQNHLVDAHSFRHPYHPDQDWNEFFLQSNHLLYPAESCDCQRSSSSQQDHKHVWAIERRYFTIRPQQHIDLY
jgi:hypothetical protein